MFFLTENTIMVTVFPIMSKYTFLGYNTKYLSYLSFIYDKYHVSKQSLYQITDKYLFVNTLSKSYIITQKKHLSMFTHMFVLDGKMAGCLLAVVLST